MSAAAFAVIASCIGCGCDDFHACPVGDERGCHWLRVDYEEGLGVCSACPEFEAQWDAGDRTPHAEPIREREAHAAGTLRMARPEQPKRPLQPGERCDHDWPYEDVRDADCCRRCGMTFVRHVFTEMP